MSPSKPRPEPESSPRQSRPERREEKRRRQRARVAKHGAGLRRVYRDAVLKRARKAPPAPER